MTDQLSVADARARAGEEDLAQRLAAIEARLELLEQQPAAPPPAPSAAVEKPDQPALPGELFWALEGLKQRATDTVLFTGAVTLPAAGHFEWQESASLEEVLLTDPTTIAASLDALAHPFRIRILQHVLRGATTVAELAAIEELGTTGQLYHHVRQLVASGWLHLLARGQYQVPGQRIVALMVAFAAARR